MILELKFHQKLQFVITLVQDLVEEKPADSGTISSQVKPKTFKILDNYPALCSALKGTVYSIHDEW